MTTIQDRLIAIAEELVAAGVHLAVAIDQFEKTYIDAGLRLSRGNVTQCAAVVGVHRNTLHNKLNKHSDMELYGAINRRRTSRQHLDARRSGRS